MYDFNFKPFEKMTTEDYEKVGFKSGLEIHQQLLTEKKLFCRCPSGFYSDKYDAEILRHMRPTLSELGEYDGTALMEFKTKKNIIYRINRNTVCTYEMDDTPPFLINEDALDIAFEIGLLFGCNLVDELHIARKQYLDGSIPTGFQRTAIFGLDGKVPYKERSIDIVQTSIEEDSCREVSDVEHDRIYLTDRLGMPLVETVTAPQMKTPQEVAEVARILSKVARSSNKVRRGMGAAREDVNVSVKGGTRIEIKGVPKISAIPLLTYNEAMRQWNLLKLREELRKRGVTEKTFESKSADVTKPLRKTHFLPIKEAVNGGSVVKAVLLKGFRDLLNWQTQTDTYFSKEISDRVRVIACLTTIPNIVHSDAKGAALTSHEWNDIGKAISCSSNDTIVLVWGSKEDTETAVNEIIIRAKEATIGIPSETRQALRDGTNGFERILPGADRMYPDTDLPPKEITDEHIESLRKNLNENFWIREKRYKKLGIPDDTIEDLSVSKFGNLFNELVGELNVNPTLAAVAIIQFPKRLKKEGVDVSTLTDEMFFEIFKAHKEGLLSRDGILTALRKSLLKGKFYPELLPPPCTSAKLDSVIKEKAKEVESIKLFNDENKNKVLLGAVMNELRLIVDGKTVAARIEKFLSGNNND
ncbi:MAG: Glu-tRNA(Gln) amidotransferase subunit GatE [Chlorobi bacterium]|nr:Glu-tRNA(Gln) amidotransferase subunit GatE [Chlorobiota bacterium]